MTKSNHTQPPFFIDTKNFDMGKSDNAHCSIRAQGASECTPWHIAEVLSSGPSPEQDAAFIVHCVNSHAALVDLLRRLDQLNDAAHGGIADYHDVWDDVKAALALVQKGT